MRRVRLAAPGEELVRRGALLLDDALRTASLPDDGRMLLVRSLALGIVRATATSASVARLIERGVGDLSARAVYALDPAAAASDVVYFRDAVEGYAALAVRIAAQQATDAWFWRLVEPRWKAAMPRDESLRTLLRAALDTPAGVAGGAALVHEVERRGALDALLSALRWQDGSPLLAAFGWSAAMPDAAGHAAPFPAAVPRTPRPLSAARAGTLTRWIGHWGTSDARSAWLAGVLLVAERPVRAMDARLPAAARALVRELTTSPGREPPHERPSRQAAARPPRTVDQGTATREMPTPPSSERECDDVTRDATSRVTNDPSPATDERAIGGSAVVPPPGAPRPTAVETVEPTIPASAPARDSARAHEAAPATGAAITTAPDGRDDECVAARDEAPPPIGAARVPVASSDDVPGTPTPDSHASEPVTPSLEHDLPAPPPGGEQPTMYGGFHLLLPLLARLQMPAFLEAHPALIEWDLPTRLLLHVARRLGLDLRDPAIAALPQDLPDEAAAWDGVLTGPEVWRPFVARVGRGAGRPPRPATEILLASWTVVMRRWCRRHVGIGLHTLVVRPARVTSTRTHIDVYFDLSQVDMRVRRAALDVDPGWLPWLGRVVQFHYRSGGGANGD